MHFTSDNAGPAHPDVIEAIARANEGDAASYGADAAMERVVARIREIFEAPDAAVHLVAPARRRTRWRSPASARPGRRSSATARPCRGRRMRRARVLHRRRQADPGRRRARPDRPARAQAALAARPRRRAQRPAGRAVADQPDRGGTAYGPQGGGARRAGPGGGHPGAHGRRALRQRPGRGSAARRPT
jgi:hypothetical protein